jgi:YHS domain-containing protein
MRTTTTFAIFAAASLGLGAIGFAIIAEAAAPPAKASDNAKAQDRPAAKTEINDLYTLETCPVSGSKLGSMGAPVVKVYDGREFRFCCEGCVPKFEAEKAKYIAAVDEKMIEQQLPYYPLDVCLNSGEPLVEDGEDIGVNVIHNNRLLRFCCRSCYRAFAKDPAEGIAMLDKAIIEKQRPGYPLTECVVGEAELGSMGEPAEVIVGNRLIRYCCIGCHNGMKKEPAKFLAILDAAWAKARSSAD